MKKVTIVALIAMFVATGLSFKTVYDIKRNSAEVNERNGVLIFTDCKPLMNYELLGTVKLGIGSSHKNNYEDEINRLSELAKRDYQDCSAIIYDNEKSYKHQAFVIKFKE